VIVGSAAGALIGLQFVVMPLIAARPPQQACAAGADYATPTVVHFSVVLPLAAYAILLLAALAAYARVDGSFFGVGASALVILFTGIHNAWDAVAYHVLAKARGETATERRDDLG